MNLKRAFAKTTCLIVSAVLLSQVYSSLQSRLRPKTFDISGFNNLASNVRSIKTDVNQPSATEKNEPQITSEIISSISGELATTIKRTRYTISLVKTKFEKDNNIKLEKSRTSPLIEMKKEIIHTAEDLSAYEINNGDLITLYNISIEKIEYSRFENIALSLHGKKIQEAIQDVVAEKVSSTESAPADTIEADEVKLIQPAPEKHEIETATSTASMNEDEMVMFDYSEKVVPALHENTSIDTTLYERPLSSAVKRAISREIGTAPIKKVETVATHQQRNEKVSIAEKVTIDDQEIDLNSPGGVVYDYSTEKTSKALFAAEKAEAYNAPAEMSTQETQFLIRAKELNLTTQKFIQLHGFEFVPDYDRAERINDSASGEIQLGYSTIGSMNIQTGLVQAQGIIPTRIEVSLGATKGIEVPLLNESGIQKFLQKQGLSIEGNLLLVATNSSIKDVEIDSSFGAKFYFDSKFKSLNQPTSANFVLFAGVKTGNILLKYLLENNESAQKIVYVGDGEMYFEDPSFKPSSRETFTFTTRNLLGQKKKELSINESKISFFNTNIVAKKKTLNSYELKIPTLAAGMRKYLELKHLNDSIFVGTSDEKEIEIPSNDFIAKALEMNQVNSLKERCVVQLNLSKEIRLFTVNGKNRSGEMFVETTYLDKDGNFTRDSFEHADKAFVVGDMEGLFSIKLDYTDGSSQFLKTFCSEGTYLVEQL